MMPEQEERRKFLRMCAETQVSYTVNNNTYYGRSCNLSANGLLMTAEQELAPEEIVDIMMNPTDERLPPFMASGRVVDCKPDKNHSGQFLISIEFITTA